MFAHQTVAVVRSPAAFGIRVQEAHVSAIGQPRVNPAFPTILNQAVMAEVAGTIRRLVSYQGSYHHDGPGDHDSNRPLTPVPWYAAPLAAKFR